MGPPKSLCKWQVAQNCCARPPCNYVRGNANESATPLRRMCRSASLDPLAKGFVSNYHPPIQVDILSASGGRIRTRNRDFARTPLVLEAVEGAMHSLQLWKMDRGRAAATAAEATANIALPPPLALLRPHNAFARQSRRQRGITRGLRNVINRRITLHEW